MHAHHSQHRLAIPLVASEGALALGDQRALPVSPTAQDRGQCTRDRPSAIGVVGDAEQHEQRA
jgi:hypothetical protein